MKVFLGGTCNDSKWRDEIKPLLANDGLEYFDPIVDDWDEKAQAQELEEREKCDICLYVLTPKMTGTYSIAEVVDDSNKRPEKTVLVVLPEDEESKFDEFQMKSLNQVSKMVKGNGGKAFKDLVSAINWMSKINKLMETK